MGAEAREPCVTEKALEYNFTNEGGVLGTWRFSKNIMGLWLVQECRRTWAQHGENLSYDEITAWLLKPNRSWQSSIRMTAPSSTRAICRPAFRNFCQRTRAGRATDERRDRALWRWKASR